MLAGHCAERLETGEKQVPTTVLVVRDSFTEEPVTEGMKECVLILKVLTVPPVSLSQVCCTWPGHTRITRDGIYSSFSADPT